MKHEGAGLRSVHTISPAQVWVNLAATHFSAFINPDFPVWRFKFFFSSKYMLSAEARLGSIKDYLNLHKVLFPRLCESPEKNPTWINFKLAMRVCACWNCKMQGGFCMCFLHIITCMTWDTAIAAPNACTIADLLIVSFQWVHAGSKSSIKDGGDKVYHICSKFMRHFINYILVSIKPEHWSSRVSFLRSLLILKEAPHIFIDIFVVVTQSLLLKITLNLLYFSLIL